MFRQRHPQQFATTEDGIDYFFESLATFRPNRPQRASGIAYLCQYRIFKPTYPAQNPT